MANFTDKLPKKIEKHAERQFLRGRDDFIARPTLANAAIFLFVDDPKRRDDIIEEGNERIVRMLARAGAAGRVYAIREDLGNGEQDSTDFVQVTMRDGEAVAPSERAQRGNVTRASTDEIDY